jgi:hypothetical protein
MTMQFAGDVPMASTTPSASIPSQPRTGEDRTLDNAGYCMLSLDGGGLRGLSTLYILQSIMSRLNFEREHLGQVSLPPRKPCELFDLIGGTSTGGYVYTPNDRNYQMFVRRGGGSHTIFFALTDLLVSLPSCSAA